MRSGIYQFNELPQLLVIFVARIIISAESVSFLRQRVSSISAIEPPDLSASTHSSLRILSDETEKLHDIINLLIINRAAYNRQVSICREQANSFAGDGRNIPRPPLQARSLRCFLFLQPMQAFRSFLKKRLQSLHFTIRLHHALSVLRRGLVQLINSIQRCLHLCFSQAEIRLQRLHFHIDVVNITLNLSQSLLSFLRGTLESICSISHRSHLLTQAHLTIHLRIPLLLQSKDIPQVLSRHHGVLVVAPIRPNERYLELVNLHEAKYLTNRLYQLNSQGLLFEVVTHRIERRSKGCDWVRCGIHCGPR
mmetsp:Transcript_29566/g.58992  ORF Transcript_29566/g.58992 Transcript_29566/m.58992 type:complete len:308 (-) Transcript_29566:1224-2147(-)